MKTAIGRLESRSGETLVETLASTLIIALAILMLASMVLSSMNLNRQTRELDRALYEEISAAEGQAAIKEPDGLGGERNKTVTVTFQSGTAVEIEANLYGTGNGLVSYGK